MVLGLMDSEIGISRTARSLRTVGGNRPNNHMRWAKMAKATLAGYQRCASRTSHSKYGYSTDAQPGKQPSFVGGDFQPSRRSDCDNAAAAPGAGYR